MQAIKTKMMVGDLVVVPDRVFMGVRDLGGVARIIRIRNTTPEMNVKTSTSQLLLMARHPKS